MITYNGKLVLADGTFIGMRRVAGSAIAFQPIIFTEDSSEVETATLVLTEEQSKAFDKILGGVLLIKPGDTITDFDVNTDIDLDRTLGARQTKATSNIAQIYLLNSSDVEIATIALTGSEVRQLSYVISAGIRTPQDIIE